MDCIKNLLKDHVDQIKSSENEMAILSYKMYDIIKQYLDDIVNLNFAGSKGKLALVGGIMINCDGMRSDRFLPLSFEVRSNSKRIDLT